MGFREVLRGAIARLREPSGGGPACPDPIDHPDLRRMSPRELADIPFGIRAGPGTGAPPAGPRLPAAAREPGPERDGAGA